MLLTFDPLPEMLLRSKILLQDMDTLLKATKGDVGLGKKKTRSGLHQFYGLHKIGGLVKSAINDLGGEGKTHSVVGRCQV